MTTSLNVYVSVFCLSLSSALAQDVHLHVDPKWKECSFQLDPSLTQQEFHEFTSEAGMVACFRPLTSARSMGAGRFEISVLQWKTTIDETKGAWNNTFVHPHEDHYLVGGSALPFPGLSVRAGITDKLDAGVYWTVRPGANYGFAGGQLQYNILNAAEHKIDVSSRLGFNALYGPDDIRFRVYALDLLASKKFVICKKWLAVAPYTGGSVSLSTSHEKSDLVVLKDEKVFGFQGMFGTVAYIKNFSLAAEYNMAVVNTMSVRLGYNFRV